MQIIRKNFTLKVLALTLAIVGWAYVRFATNPVVATARFDQQMSVPITSVNLTAGYVAHFTDREAVVTVAPRRGEAAIKPEEIKAVLDLAGKGAGVYNVPVALVAPQIVVQSLSPASVTLTIEKIESRDFPLAVHYVGDLQERRGCRDAAQAVDRRDTGHDHRAGTSRGGARRHHPARASPFGRRNGQAGADQRGRSRSARPAGRARPGARSPAADARHRATASMSRLFGTDGIRGVANEYLTPELAFAVGRPPQPCW